MRIALLGAGSIGTIMHTDTIILTLQNGIPEDISREFVKEDRVMGGGVEFGATWLEPGVSELTTEPETLGITFGPLNGRITTAMTCIAHLGREATMIIENAWGNLNAFPMPVWA